jgi:MFS family permease
MGVIGAALALGFIAGPLVGGALVGGTAASLDIQTPAFLAAGLSFLAFCVGLLLMRESRIAWKGVAETPARRVGEATALVLALRRRTPAMTVAIVMLATFAFFAMEATFAIWMEQRYAWGARDVGYAFAYAAAVAVAIQLAALGWLARRFGEWALVIQATTAHALGLLLIAFSPHPAIVLAGLTLIACGFAVGDPILCSLICRSVPPSMRGGSLGLVHATAGAGRVLGPVCGGYGYVHIGQEWPFLSGAAALLVATAVASWAASPERHGERVARERRGPSP